VTLREEHQLRVFGKRVLRKIFGPNRDEVTGEWWRLHNVQLQDCLGNETKKNEIVEACGTYWDKRGSYRFWEGGRGKTEAKRMVGRPKCGWKDKIRV
jgi:hypothetical protein